MDDASETDRELAASDTLAATHGAQRSFSSEQLEAGACIGRYFVIRKLGAGAMGVVYAAYDPKLDRKLALKLLARTEATAGARERLQREAISEAALGPDHPELIDPLTRLGDTLLALGAPSQALAQLERASSIHDAHEVDPVALASTRFALARALWDAPATAGRDRPRARELAELAAGAFEIAGDKADDELAKVRVWQAEHGEQDPP